MTTTSTGACASINLAIIPTPGITQVERDRLLGGLKAALDGKEVTISIKYHKVTKTKVRIEGEDYASPLPPEFLIGTIKKVAVGKRGPYILLDATITRDPEGRNGKAIGWTSIKGEGIDAVLKVTTPKTTPTAQ